MTLKAYKILNREEGGWIEVQCPRRDCKGRFKVKARQWAESWHGHGRSCTYCFRPSALPPRKKS